MVGLFEIPTFMAPSPIDVAYAFHENAGILWTNTLPTLMEAALGFLFGNLVALLLAIWFVHSTTAEKALFPIAVFIKAIPIIALAPILVLIVGNGLPRKSSSPG